MNAEQDHPVFKSMREAREAIEAILKRWKEKFPIITEMEKESDGEEDLPQ